MTIRISRVRRLAGLVAMVALSATSTVVTAEPAYAAPSYIFTTFKGDAAADQELWVYTAASPTVMNVLADTNYQGPTGAVRDPSIIRHTDGWYYVTYTVASWGAVTTTFNIARSQDLRAWSHVATVPAGVTGARHTWAPEFFVEGSTVRIITSVETGDWRFVPYVYTAQNSALTSWSAPRALGIPANHIDTAIMKAGSTYHAYVKNETTLYIEHWTSPNLTNWTYQATRFPYRHEGPSLLRQPDGTFRIYIDKYTSGGMWTATSTDLYNWSALTQVACSGCRHGTVIYDANYGGPTTSHYRVTARHSGKVMDVQSPNTSDGAKVGQYAWNGGAWQQWEFRSAGSGYVNLVSRHSGKCLDVAGGSAADGVQLSQWTCNGGTNQQFQMVAVGSYFQLRARHSGKCVDVPAASTADGVVLTQYTCNNGTNQQWSRSTV